MRAPVPGAGRPDRDRPDRDDGTGKHNYWYLTGHLTQDFESNTRPTVLLVPARGEPAAVLYQQRKPAARAAAFPRLYGYEDVPLSVWLLIEAMRDSGLDGGRVGCELGDEQRLGLPLKDFDALREGLPHVRWVDAAAPPRRVAGAHTRYQP